MPGANLSKLTWEIIPGRPARCIAIPFETRARSFLTDSPSSSSFFSLILSKKRQFRYFFSLLEPRNIVKDLLERIVSSLSLCLRLLLSTVQLQGIGNKTETYPYVRI